MECGAAAPLSLTTIRARRTIRDVAARAKRKRRNGAALQNLADCRNVRFMERIALDIQRLPDLKLAAIFTASPKHIWFMTAQRRRKARIRLI